MHNHTASTGSGSRVWLVFTLPGKTAALPVETVEQIVPMAELLRPPALPHALEGVLNLAGEAVPILRLDRIFGLQNQIPGLYSALLILRIATGRRIGILADRVNEMASVPAGDWVPLDPQDSFNGCAEAAFRMGNTVVHVLSPEHLLAAKEREALAQFQQIAERRLKDWEAFHA